MKNASQNSQKSSPILQFVVNFVIPIIILTRLSSESLLGPTKGMILALAFPVAFEVYNVYKRKKLSLLSAIAIGGILVTGAVSLLGLSEGWLALRRSAFYFALATAIVVSMIIKRPILNAMLPQIIDIERVNALTKKNKTEKKLKVVLNQTSYLVGILFAVIAIISYVLTLIVIKSPTGTSGFNQEYASLRVLSLLFATLPLLIGLGIVIMYLYSKIAKLTGLAPDDLIKKKK